MCLLVKNLTLADDKANSLSPIVFAFHQRGYQETGEMTADFDAISAQCRIMDMAAHFNCAVPLGLLYLPAASPPRESH